MFLQEKPPVEAALAEILHPQGVHYWATHTDLQQPLSFITYYARYILPQIIDTEWDAAVLTLQGTRELRCHGLHAEPISGTIVCVISMGNPHDPYIQTQTRAPHNGHSTVDFVWSHALREKQFPLPGWVLDHAVWISAATHSPWLRTWLIGRYAHACEAFPPPIVDTVNTLILDNRTIQEVSPEMFIWGIERVLQESP